jgi:cyanophycinase
LALVGGDAWNEGCEFDADLLAASGGTEVLLVTAAAAFQNPGKLVARATAWFEAMGATVKALPMMQRPGAMDDGNATAVREARFIYLTGGSPLHLRSVLKETPVWAALEAAWSSGAVVAGDGTSASALCDPMVDPRGGAFTVGLGLVDNLAVLPHADDRVTEHHRRTLELADAGLVLAAIPDRTALIRDPNGTWRTAGRGVVRAFVEHKERALDVIGA